MTTVAGLFANSGSVDGIGSAARFFQPEGLAVDGAGNIYVADSYNHTIRKIDSSGRVTTLAGFAGSSGSTDGQGSEARFFFPSGIAVGAGGTIYVTDTYNYTVRKITAGGLVSTLAGSPGAYGSTDGSGGAARFAYPAGITFGSDGSLLIADSYNYTVRKVTPSGVVNTLAGYPGGFSPGSVDGPGSVARFNSPRGIAVGGDGRLYVADTGNNTVRTGVPSLPPPNDNFAGAVALSGVSGTLEGNNIVATVEAGEPQHAGYVGGHSVWYQWTAPQTGVFSFKAVNAPFTTLLAIYTGSEVERLTVVASAAYGQTAMFRAVAGTTYRIAVDGLNGATGAFTLFWAQITNGPSNDDFANPQRLSGTTGSVGGTTEEATVEPGEPNHAGISGYHSIWYSWTAPADGRFNFDDAGSSYGTVLAIYTGSAVDALTLAGESGNYSGTSRVSIQAIAGTTYQIALDSWQPNFYGPTILSWHAANAPPNDDFANAEDISGTTGLVTGSTVDATKEQGEPSHQLDLGGASIWYRWTASTTGRFQFDVAGTFSSQGSPLLAAYSGETVNGLRGLARGGAARLQFDAVEGNVYYLAVDAYGGETANDVIMRWQILPNQQRTYQPFTFTVLAGIKPGNIDGSGSNARFNRSSAAALGLDGNLYLADTYNHTIRKVTPGGTVTTFAGSPGEKGSADGTGAAARFSLPSGIAAGPGGFIYVADSANHTIRKISPAGIVSTLAGSPGIFGTLDGPGTTALFDYPFGVAVDASGTVFLTDQFSSTIRRVTAAGEVSTIAGRPGASGSNDGIGANARFNFPAGIVEDGNGNLYVADQFNYTIRKITPAGAVSTYAGRAGSYGTVEGTGSAANFTSVNGLALDGSGNLYVADRENNRIRKIAPGAVVTTLAGGGSLPGSEDGTGSAARFRNPLGIAATAAGELYVADTGNMTVRFIDTSATVSTLAGLVSGGIEEGAGGAARFRASNGVAVDGDGNTYVADTGNHTIRKVTPAGVTSLFAGMPAVSGALDGTGSAARFRSPRGVAVGPDGIVYVADTANNTIRKITPAGVVSTLAGATTSGSADGTGATARFRTPGALTVDASSNLYVADTNNHTLRKITSGGVVTTLAGFPGSTGSADGSGSVARFNFPRGITLDGSGNLYVADTNNHTIRKVTAAGFVQTFAGIPGVYGDNDGTGADARLYFPYSIAAGGSNDLFVADRSNHLIRKISDAAVVTTVAGFSRQNGSQGGAGSDIRFDNPTGIAAGPGGKLYVVDVNNAIRTGAPSLLLTSAVSRKAHGTAGSFDLGLPLTGTPGVESRNGAHSIIASFSNAITAGSATVSSGAGSVSGTSINGNTVTVSLTGVVNRQTITVTLSNVTDSFGQTTPPLDVRMNVLFGDRYRQRDSERVRHRSGESELRCRFDSSNFPLGYHRERQH